MGKPGQEPGRSLKSPRQFRALDCAVCARVSHGAESRRQVQVAKIDNPPLTLLLSALGLAKKYIVELGAEIEFVL